MLFENCVYVTLKTGICDVMSNALKDLSVSFSSPINFEIKQ